MAATVAGCCHIRTFIAGATSTGLSVASSTVAARSSASPAAMRASRSALAGATTSRSAARESWIWPISLSSVSEKRSVYTLDSLSAWTDSGVTNWAAARLSTQVTPQPAPRSRRISSSAL